MTVSSQRGIRAIIDGFATGRRKRSVYLGRGDLYMVPSSSELGAYYVVGIINGKGEGIKIDNCKGFRFNRENSCQHTDEAVELRYQRKKRRSKK